MILDKNRFNKIIMSSVLAGSLIVGSCGFALASSTAGASTGSSIIAAADQNARPGGDFRDGRKGFLETKLQSVLDSLVEKGTLTQEQAEQLLSFLKQQAEEQKGKAAGRFQALVDEGILTQDEAEALAKQIRTAAQARHQEQIQSFLDALVTDGTIDQSKADRLISFLEKQAESQKADPQAAPPQSNQNQNQNQNGNYPKARHAGFLAAAVQEGVLTQDEADAIAEKMKTVMEAKRQEEMKSALEKLVAAGTISQSTADQLLAFKPQPPEKNNANNNSQSTQPQSRSPFAAAVEQGILTQEQAEALAKQMHAAQDRQQEEIQSALDALVDNGTIDQSKADKVLSCLQQQKEQRQATASDQLKKRQQFNPFTAAVEKGIISQEQADAIKSALDSLMQKRASISNSN